MDYRQAYHSLLEIFPQVDNRILKAVAIEHWNDVHAAMEFIICDVLPFQLKGGEGAVVHRLHVSSSVDGNIIDLGDSVSGLSRNDNGAVGEDHCKNVIDLADVNSVVGDSEDYFENAVDLAESVVESSHDRNSIISKIEDDCENLDGSHMEPLPCDTEVVYQDEDEPTFRSTQNVINIEGAVVHRPDMSSSVDGNIIDLGDSVSGLSRNDNSAVGEDHCKNVIDLADGNSVVGDSEDYFENAVDLAESIVESSHDRKSIIGKIEDGCENLDGSHMELLPCDTEVVYQDEDEPTIRSTRNVINIDVLEDCVAEAKTNKKALTSAMESIVELTRVAEILEERAQQAKEEASPAGQDIVAHVEALKQMMQHAKQTNDMHAGEVFGEKAILLTEAKELQFHLHNLSDERNKFCSIINEIHETLEARIAAAKDEIAAAEREKLEKEGLAKKALKEQEDLLEAIAQESNKLQQDADENAKLRDFLMDRGRLVDTLQGEMAVIFEDVMVLKNIVDERMPLKGSLLMRTYSVASSSSSYSHKSIHSADALLVTVEQGRSTGEGAEDQQSPALEEAIAVGNSEKANAGCREETIADGDWELLKRDACAF